MSEVEMHARTVSNITMKPQKWPFTSENQDEVSSRFLGIMMKELRGQVEVQGAAFMSMSRHFMKKYQERIIGMRIEKEKKILEAKRRLEEEEQRENEVLRLKLEHKAKIEAEKEYDEMQKELKKEEARKRKADRAAKVGN